MSWEVLSHCFCRITRFDAFAVSSVSFSCEDATLFIAGTDSGNLLKCILRDEPGVSGRSGTAASFSFQPHAGPVSSVAASPFHRNLFLSASTDTTLRLYSQLQVSVEGSRYIQI